MSDAEWAAGGDAVSGLVDNGVEWVTTYGLPAAITALGIGFVIALTVRFGKKSRGWLS